MPTSKFLARGVLCVLLVLQTGCATVVLWGSTRHGRHQERAGEARGVDEVVAAKLVDNGRGLRLEVTYQGSRSETLYCALRVEPGHGGVTLAQLDFEGAPFRWSDQALPVVAEGALRVAPGPHVAWRLEPDGTACVRHVQGTRVSRLVIPRSQAPQTVSGVGSTVVRAALMPLTLSLDLATLPLQLVLLPVGAHYVMMILGPV